MQPSEDPILKFYDYGETRCMECGVIIYTAPSHEIGEYASSSHMAFFVCDKGHVYCEACAGAFERDDSYPVCRCASLMGSYSGLRHPLDDEKRIHRSTGSDWQKPGARRCLGCETPIHLDYTQHIMELPGEVRVRFSACGREHIFCEECMKSLPVREGRRTCACGWPIESFVGMRYPHYMSSEQGRDYIENKQGGVEEIEMEYILSQRPSGFFRGKSNRMEDD